MEIGIGIHGEPGRRRVPLAPAARGRRDAGGAGPGRPRLPGDGGVIAFVNGMGATPLLELYLMYAEVAALPGAAGHPVARSLVGNYVTCLDMAGCSVTLLRVDDELLRLWDAPVNTPAPALGGVRRWRTRRGASGLGPRLRARRSTPRRPGSPSWTRRSATPTTAAT